MAGEGPHGDQIPDVAPVIAAEADGVPQVVPQAVPTDKAAPLGLKTAELCGAVSAGSNAMVWAARRGRS